MVFFFFCMYGFNYLGLGLKGMEWRICGNIWRNSKHRDPQVFPEPVWTLRCVCRCIGRVVAYTGWGKGHQGWMCYYWHYWDFAGLLAHVIKTADWLWSVLVLILWSSLYTLDPYCLCQGRDCFHCSIPSTPPFPHPVLPWSLTQWSLKIPSGLKYFYGMTQWM